MALMFWKKKRNDAPKADAIAVADVSSVEEVVVDDVAPIDLPEPEPEPIPAVEPEPEPDPEPEPVAAVEPVLDAAPVAELEPVELPKRTFRKGIRSLFSRIKFDPENLDELEDILIQADFGVDASLQIVNDVKQRARQAGAETEAQLKQILADVIASNLTRDDSALNLSDGKLPYVFLVVGVNGVGKTTTAGRTPRWGPREPPSRASNRFLWSQEPSLAAAADLQVAWLGDRRAMPCWRAAIPRPRTHPARPRPRSPKSETRTRNPIIRPRRRLRWPPAPGP